MSIEAIKKGLDALGYVMSHGAQVQTAKDILTQAIEQSEKQEPVGKFAKFSDGVWKEVTEGSAGVLLYTSPPPRQPLTDEEIVSVANTVDGFGVIKQRDMNFARAIEAAHGIGEKP